MSNITEVHNRLYSINGEWQWDGEPITDAEANHLRLHYKDLCAKLQAPWKNRDEWYDELGRLNYSWRKYD